MPDSIGNIFYNHEELLGPFMRCGVQCLDDFFSYVSGMVLFIEDIKKSKETNMSQKRKKSISGREMKKPFGPPQKEYNYRCSVCRTELLVNEAIIDTGIGMAKFQNEYYDGYMPKVECPGCNNYTMECVEEL